MFDREICWEAFKLLPKERQKDVVEAAVTLFAKEFLKFFMDGGQLEELLRE